jgi:hypothetical protein
LTSDDNVAVVAGEGFTVRSLFTGLGHDPRAER